MHSGAGSLKGKQYMLCERRLVAEHVFHTLRDWNGMADKRCPGRDGLRLLPMSGGQEASNRVEPRITSSLNWETEFFCAQARIRKF